MTHILPQLSEAEIKDFQALYAAELGAALSDADARTTAEEVLSTVAWLYELDSSEGSGGQCR